VMGGKKSIKHHYFDIGPFMKGLDKDILERLLYHQLWFASILFWVLIEYTCLISLILCII
jgi:hypothetical protein